MQDILLSIAIPTFNRAKWLKLCLTQLIPQLQEVGNRVEVTVYDNASPDNTREVVSSFLGEHLALSYVLNSENIGSDRNIAQCFNKAIGRYVLILGDDDVIIPGALAKIMNILKNDQSDFGVVYIKAYGYDDSFIEEMPFQIRKRPIVYSDVNDFICRCSNSMAFISSLVINKSKIPSIDANRFINTSLVQTYLFYEAAREAKQNLYVGEYLIAAKRIESRDYDVTKVFASALNDALDYFVSRGFSQDAVKKINRKLIWYFFPFFILQLRYAQSSEVASIETSYALLKKRYRCEPAFWICLMPIFKLPRVLAKLWALIIIIGSRVFTLEFGRLFVAFSKKLNTLKVK